jgi:hypothetical protein
VKIYKVMGGVAAVGAVCLLLAAVLGNPKHGVKGAIADVSWFGFLGSAAALIVLALAALGRGAYRRTTAV